MTLQTVDDGKFLGRSKTKLMDVLIPAYSTASVDPVLDRAPPTVC